MCCSRIAGDPGTGRGVSSLASAEAGNVILGTTLERITEDPRFRQVTPDRADTIRSLEAAAADCGRVSLPARPATAVIRYAYLWLATDGKPGLALAAYELATR